MRCPSIDTLFDCAGGQDDPTVAQHLNQCGDCAGVVMDLERFDAEWEPSSEPIELPELLRKKLYEKWPRN